VYNQAKTSSESPEDCAKIEAEIRSLEEDNKTLTIEIKGLSNGLASSP
jgi:uncharacterized protein YlxW (UPF0749 family)